MTNKPSPLTSLTNINKPIIGMIHALPTAGSPKGYVCNIDELYEHGIREAKTLMDGGVDALLIENAGDVPFLKPEKIGLETIALMSVLGSKIIKEVNIPVGFNIVANAALASLACAKASGAQFVRVNQWANAYIANEGFVEGAAADALRYRNQIDAKDVLIFADVHVKHGSHAIVSDRSVEEQARDVAFFNADVAIATGTRTGHKTSVEEIQQIKKGSNLPTIVGSGLTSENAKEILTVADGAIVGVSLKDSGNMSGNTDINKVKHLMDIVGKLR